MGIGGRGGRVGARRGAVSRTETFATPEERDAALSALFKGRGEAAPGCAR